MRALFSVAVLLAVGCGSKTGLKVPETEPDASMPPVDLGPDLPPPPPDLGSDLGEECVPFRAEARLASLDIFLAMDVSGSMEQPTASGESKFEAITGAVDGFVTAPDSEGIGVDLTFFPFVDESVPENCSSDAACGGGPDQCAEPDVCLPSGDAFCFEDADCATAGDSCQPLGVCGGFDPSLCLDLGDTCPDGSRCRDYGFCLNRTSCDVASYMRPAVPLGLLPGVSGDIVAALEGATLDGGTPTLPALTGVLERARQWSLENPGSKVISILATDGFPESCDPAVDLLEDDPSVGIIAPSEVAADAAADGIETYVIGVFGPDEEVEARANLSTLAMAGGTEEALVVSTDEDVTDLLLEILDELRRSVRTCVYAIPAAGVLPDPETLQVRILPPDAGPIELERVPGPAACDPMLGGFFFEGDLEPGDRPGFIELCPASCNLTAASDDFVVEMQAGCDE